MLRGGARRVALGEASSAMIGESKPVKVAGNKSRLVARFPLYSLQID